MIMFVALILRRHLIVLIESKYWVLKLLIIVLILIIINGKADLQFDLYCVEWGVKLYSLQFVQLLVPVLV